MSVKNKIIVIIAVIVFVFTGLSLLTWLPHYEIPVLMYHHVAVPGPSAPGNYVSPEKFRQQMAYIKQRGYEVIDLDTYYEYVAGRKKIKKRNLIVITFDDGYKDNFINALPVLEEFDFPACIFMAAGKVGQPDRLDVQEIKTLIEKDVTIGSHTFNEVYLPDLKIEDVEFELCHSRKVLEDITGEEVNYLCYPTGGFSGDIKGIARKCGYRMAFTTNRGYVKSYKNRDVFEIKRVKMKETDNLLALFLKLSGRYNIFRKVKDPQ